jgi:uncharacterized membrane protein
MSNMKTDMGPVQLLVFGFDRPKFGGGIAAELNRLRERDYVRVIDALVVHKNAEGEVRTMQVTDLGIEDAERLGAIVGALVGAGAAGEEGIAPGAQAGIDAVSEHGGHVLGDEQTWDVLSDIPNDSAAALVLLEHRWAIPLRNAILEEGGVAIGDIWLHPRDLIAVGLMAASEASGEERAA